MKENSQSIATTRKISANMLLYMAAVILFWVGLYIYAPTLPVYIEEKTGSLSVVGVILSMYGLWQVIFRLPVGIASDWIGKRKPFIIAGLLLTSLGAWVLGTSNTTTGMLVGRSITGIAAATWVPLLVIFSQFFPADEAVKATTLLTLISSISRMVSTGVTGFFNDLGGYILPFYIAAGVSLLAAVLVLPAGEKTTLSQKRTVGDIMRLISRTDVLGPGLLNMFLQYCSYATTFGFLPILAKNLGAGDVLLSALMSLYLGFLTLGNLAATILLKRIGINRLVILAFVLTSGAILAAALAKSFVPVIAAQLISGFAMGTGTPILMGMSIQKVQPSDRATAMGLHQGVYAIGMFAGPWLSGIMADVMGIQPMFAITAGLCLAFGLIGLKFLNR